MGSIWQSIECTTDIIVFFIIIVIVIIVTLINLGREHEKCSVDYQVGISPLVVDQWSMRLCQGTFEHEA